MRTVLPPPPSHRKVFLYTEVYSCRIWGSEPQSSDALPLSHRDYGERGPLRSSDKKFLIIKKILPVRTVKNVIETVWRICPLILGCEWSVLRRRSWENRNRSPFLYHYRPWTLVQVERLLKWVALSAFFKTVPFHPTFNVAPELNDIFTIMRAWIFSITWLLWRIC